MKERERPSPCAPCEHPCDPCTACIRAKHSKNEHVTKTPRVGKECAGYSTWNSSYFLCNVSDLVVFGPMMFCLRLLKSTPVHTLSQGNHITTHKNNSWILSRETPSTSNYAQRHVMKKTVTTTHAYGTKIFFSNHILHPCPAHSMAESITCACTLALVHVRIKRKK